ncbi:hypothetical protein GCM10025868_15370 [Angustibacter aerolatus]|uniref:Uncharacterized protein n=1 Tax=Angustibacter aerolatus TaxID=1162965 RepID=A0ABQ6JES9_9ACTN|nr:hypothetical protein GCM10025868_15370 [Angustibacter aerolatus]
MIARIGRRLFGSTLLGCTAALLLAFDGHHFVHSRTGLLDLFVMFWALAAFGALLIDRDRTRLRLARHLADGEPERLRRRVPSARLPGFGPWLGLRPWRFVAAVCLGLCAGTKWSGLFFLAVFGLMTVLWDLGARRAVGVRRWVVGGLLKDGLPAFLVMVPTAVAVYLASWTGWFATRGGWDRQWGRSTRASGSGSCPTRCAACGTTTRRCTTSTSRCTRRTRTRRTRGRG